MGKSRNTVSRWIHGGKLAATPIGNLVLIPKEEVDRLLKES